MAQINDLISRLRLEITDQPSQFVYKANGDGTSTTFTLGYKPIDPLTLQVTVNGNIYTNPQNYTLEEEIGVLHLKEAPAPGTPIVVMGNAYRYFTDSDLMSFINTAITQHTYNRTDAFGSQITVGSLPTVEEYPLVILAAIESMWVLATDASYDINITAPDGIVIPRAQRYQQLTSLIAQRLEQYKTLCSQLNIGLYRIEMGTLIRTSRTTNKLIPIYMAQEVDDSRRPERVYIKNDLMGRNPQPSYGQIYDITLYQGDSFSCEFDFPFDTSGYTFKAQVRTYPNAPSLYATFTITTISTSSTLSKIRLTLDDKATAYMPVRAFWDLQATSNSDSTYEVTYIHGQVFTVQQVTLD